MPDISDEDISDAQLTEVEEIFTREDKHPTIRLLFDNLKNKLPELTQLLIKCSDHRYEDSVYRFYHQSRKIWIVQHLTTQIVDSLQSLLPNYELNEWFILVVNEGTGKEFNRGEDNRRWLEVTRPILEAFFHARYFLEMAVKYGNELEYPPMMLPSGWASLLYLYNLRYATEG